MAWRGRASRTNSRWSDFTKRPKLAVNPTPPAPAPRPNTLTDEERQLIEQARQRPCPPNVWREIERRGLTKYL